jgi:hypothetical protein
MAKANVTVRQGDTFLANVPVYAFKTDDTYLGLSNVTGLDGLTEFLLTGTSYKFRADFNGHQYWSGNVSLVANATIPVDVDVDGAWVNVTVEKEGGIPFSGVNVYAFTASGGYIGLFNTTNETGITAIRLSAGQFMFRADYLDCQFWSEALSVPENRSATISIPYLGASRFNCFRPSTPNPALTVMIATFLIFFASALKIDTNTTVSFQTVITSVA